MIMSIKHTIGIHLVLIVLLSSLGIVRQAEGDTSCVDLKFLNQRSDIIHATVNRSINVMFEVARRNCSSAAGVIFIKISRRDDMYSTEECKLTHNVSHCSVSTRSSACYCVTSAGPVIFSKTFTHVTNVSYTWSWQLGSDVKDRAFVFIVTNYNDTSDDAIHDLNHQTTLIGGVVASSAIFVLGGIIAGIVACCRQNMKNQAARPSIQKDRSPKDAYWTSSQKRSDSFAPQSEIYVELSELRE